MPVSFVRSVVFFVVILLAIVITRPVFAVTFTWQGDVNNNYGNERNWSQDSGSGDTPGSSDIIILPSDADGFRLDLGSSSTVREVAQVQFITDGSTGGGGFNWQFLDGTLKVLGDQSSSSGTWQNTGSGSSITVAGKIEFDGSASKVRLHGGAGGAQTLILNDSFSGSGVLSMSSFNNGRDDTLQLNASNAFSGEVEVAYGTLFLNNLNTLPSASVDLLTNGKLTFINGANVTLEPTLTNLVIPAGLTLNAKVISGEYRSVTGSGTLVLDDQFSNPPSSISFDRNSTFSGRLDLDLRNTTLEEQGAFPNAFIDLSSGNSLICDVDTSLGGLIGSGTLSLRSNTVTIGGGGNQVANEFTGLIAGTGGKIILSAGENKIYRLTNAVNTFPGELQVNAAELEVGNTSFQNNHVNLLASGETTLGSLSTEQGFPLSSDLRVGGNDQDVTLRGTFSGDGGITKIGGGNTILDGDFTTTGKLFIDSGRFDVTGTTEVGGDLEFDSEVRLDVSNNTAELINVTGELKINGFTLTLRLDGNQTADVIPLFTYDSLVGTFNSVTGVPSGYSLFYGYNGNTISLVDTRGPQLSSASGLGNLNVPAFDLTFDEAITGLDPTDFTFTAPVFQGTSNIVVSSLGGNSYRVSIFGLSGSGNIELSFSNNALFLDSLNNPFTGQGNSTGVVISDYANVAPQATIAVASGQASA